MTATKQFIEDAIEGGVKGQLVEIGDDRWGILLEGEIVFESTLLLKPSFWKAVGKTRGWDKELRMSFEGYCKDDECNTDNQIDEAYRAKEFQFMQFMFINEVQEGKSIEEALSAITN